MTSLRMASGSPSSASDYRGGMPQRRRGAVHRATEGQPGPVRLEPQAAPDPVDGTLLVFHDVGRFGYRRPSIVPSDLKEAALNIIFQHPLKQRVY